MQQGNIQYATQCTVSRNTMLYSGCQMQQGNIQYAT